MILYTIKICEDYEPDNIVDYYISDCKNIKGMNRIIKEIKDKTTKDQILKKELMKDKGCDLSKLSKKERKIYDNLYHWNYENVVYDGLDLDKVKRLKKD